MLQAEGGIRSPRTRSTNPKQGGVNEMPHKPAEQFDFLEKKCWKKTARDRDLWMQFMELRESLKSKGMSGGSAWLAAARQLGWVHHENPRSGHMRGDPCEVCAQFGEGDQGINQDKAKGAREAIQAGETDSAEAVSAPAKPSSYASHDIVLMPKEMANSKTRQDISADIEWVVEQLAIEGVTPEDAPTARAWSLYSIAKVSQLGMQMVLQHHKSMMPTGKQLNAESNHGNLSGKKLAEFESYLDSDEHVGLLGSDALQLQGAEEPASERVVSKADHQARERKRERS